ncbi:hypothetical protein TcCL_ESM11865 [Trypanosoma cruzi]|nr:hypothetical protein TcCL_ESM11865 [Trypanosoma cruzi]
MPRLAAIQLKAATQRNSVLMPSTSLLPPQKTHKSPTKLTSNALLNKAAVQHKTKPQCLLLPSGPLLSPSREQTPIGYLKQRCTPATHLLRFEAHVPHYQQRRPRTVGTHHIVKEKRIRQSDNEAPAGNRVAVIITGSTKTAAVNCG